MYTYFAYGLGIRSNFPLPEFVSADSQCDVTIHLESDEAPADLIRDDSYVELAAGEATLAFKDAGVFRIREGREIWISPAPGTDLPLIRLYLVGKVMATLLYLRGYLVLHASAVEVDGHAVAFVGTSGFGKSSMTASLHRCGFRVIADDVTAIDLSRNPPLAIPAFPLLRLDPHVARSLGHSVESLIMLHPEEWKHGLPVADNFASTPLPLGLIYLLGTDDAADSQPLPPQDVLIELVGHSFPARLMRSGGAPHLRQCASLAKLVPILRLSRPPSRPGPFELAARLRKDLVGGRPSKASGFEAAI